MIDLIYCRQAQVEHYCNLYETGTSNIALSYGTILSDREGHGHKAVVYKSHFPPLRHSVVTKTPADTLTNKPHLTKDQALCSLCPHDMVAACI